MKAALITTRPREIFHLIMGKALYFSYCWHYTCTQQEYTLLFTTFMLCPAMFPMFTAPTVSTSFVGRFFTPLGHLRAVRDWRPPSVAWSPSEGFGLGIIQLRALANGIHHLQAVGLAIGYRGCHLQEAGFLFHSWVGAGWPLTQKLVPQPAVLSCC